MANIPLPQIRFGKTKEYSVMCKIRTMAGKVEIREFGLKRGNVYDEEAKRAFYINPDSQYKDEDGNWYQILDEKSAIPYSFKQKALFNPEELTRQGETSFRVGFNQAVLESVEDIKKSEVLDKFFKIVIVISATILVIVGLRYFGG